MMWYCGVNGNIEVECGWGDNKEVHMLPRECLWSKDWEQVIDDSIAKKEKELKEMREREDLIAEDEDNKEILKSLMLRYPAETILNILEFKEKYGVANKLEEYAK